MTEDGPSSPSVSQAPPIVRRQRTDSFARQVSAPSPESEALPEKKKSFMRQVSDPGPDGREQLSFVRKAKLLGNTVLRSHARSSDNLVRSLHQEAVKAKQQPPWALITGIVIFNVIGKIGDAVGPAMVGSHPFELLLLNASNTHCILTTTTVSFLPWLIVGVGRRFCEDPMYFYAGWKYRDSCLTMLRDWSPDMADGLDKAEGFFKNNLYAAVVLNPGATVCSLAGASRMPPVAFFALNIGSTTAQLVLMRYICMQFPGRIDDALEMISKYMKLLLAIMVVITIIGAMPMLRKKQHTD